MKGKLSFYCIGGLESSVGALENIKCFFYMLMMGDMIWLISFSLRPFFCVIPILGEGKIV